VVVIRWNRVGVSGSQQITVRLIDRTMFSKQSHFHKFVELKSISLFVANSAEILIYTFSEILSFLKTWSIKLKVLSPEVKCIAREKAVEDCSGYDPTACVRLSGGNT